MHPETIIELIVAALIVLILFGSTIFVPIKFRKMVRRLAFTGTLAIGLFFLVRPLWIDIKLDNKTEQLHGYLTEKYPDETWEIYRKGTPQHHRFQLEVQFDNEPGWIYTYFIDDSEIYQLSWSVPDGQIPDDGGHYEPTQ